MIKTLLSIALCVAVSGCGATRAGVKVGAKTAKVVIKTTAKVVK